MNLSESIASSVKGRKKILLEKALSIGVSIDVLSEEFDLLSMRYNQKERLLLGGKLPFNSKYSTLFTKNKELTKILLKRGGITVPNGFLAKSYEEAAKKISEGFLSYPVVVKPLDAAKGLGVSVNITNDNELAFAIKNISAIWEENQKLSRIFIVEEMVYGCDYRILVLNGAVIACAQRVPASVFGNNKDSIESLIKKHNSNRPENYHLIIDNDVRRILEEQGKTLESIPNDNEKITLRKNANISSGGTAIDKTNEISDFFKEIAIKSANLLGLSYCGVDIYTEDISKINAQYYIIEINGAPDYDIHEKPVIQGDGVDVTEKIVMELFK